MKQLCPIFSKTSLARRTGFTDTTVRHTLCRFATIGQELIQASDDERQAYLTPVL
jgi:hypothetical protein